MRREIDEVLYGRTRRGVLGQAEAAEMGVSDAPSGAGGIALTDGAEGLYDRRLGRLSARRAPVDVARVLALFDTRCFTGRSGGRARL